MNSPNAEIRNPLTKQADATAIAQRGPLASTLVPNSAADSPSMMIPSVNGSALATPEMPSPASNGGLNTLHAYAWPIDRWIDSAAGGMSQRLHPGRAMIRSRCRNPTVMLAPDYVA